MVIHPSPVDSPNKDQWRGALMCYLICASTNGWSKQSRRRWFETPMRSVWRQCNGPRLLQWRRMCSRCRYGTQINSLGPRCTWKNYENIKRKMIFLIMTLLHKMGGSRYVTLSLNCGQLVSKICVDMASPSNQMFLEEILKTFSQGSVYLLRPMTNSLVTSCGFVDLDQYWFNTYFSEIVLEIRNFLHENVVEYVVHEGKTLQCSHKVVMVSHMTGNSIFVNNFFQDKNKETNQTLLCWFCLKGSYQYMGTGDLLAFKSTRWQANSPHKGPTSIVYWCIASKLNVPLFFYGMNKTLFWVDLSFFNQSYSGDITTTKSLPDIGGTTYHS